jgi:undecaprenyl-diphosphatase
MTDQKPTADTAANVERALETPVAPEPAPETQPVKQAVEDALRSIKTEAQAEQAAATLEAVAGDAKEKDVREAGVGSQQPGQAIAKVAEEASETAAPAGEKAPATLIEAAKQVAAADGDTREELEQAVQDATNPARQAQSDPAVQEGQALLQEALFHRMKPLQALDARAYLAVNHMPHPELLSQFMQALSVIMNGGFGWVAGLLIATALDGRRHKQPLYQLLTPLWVATMTVEYPIKFYFRRKRPFIDIVQAVAVGKKPGTYSFPSGHSAAGFAGAWLLSRSYPQFALLWYAIAALVAFSRVYLGVHYPGDVLSGAVVGTALAETTRWVVDRAED